MGTWKVRSQDILECLELYGPRSIRGIMSDHGLEYDAAQKQLRRLLIKDRIERISYGGGAS